MKLKQILPILCLPLLAACNGGTDNGKTMADYKDATTADSLTFYFGQMRAAEYWRNATVDSTFASRESRDEFLKGVRAGMDAVRNNDMYNQGVYMGIQLAMNLGEIDREYELKTSKAILLDALDDGLRNDSVVDYNEASVRFSQIMNALNERKELNDRTKGQEALAAEAKALKMTRLSDDLYAGTPTKPGDGELLQIGDSVAVMLTVTQIGVGEIDHQADPHFKVGSKLIGPVTDALLTMRVGESRDFITTPPALMGRIYTRRGLKPNDILKFNITTSPVK